MNLIQGSFAFVDFENDGDAEKAMKELINKDMGGLKINIGKFFVKINLNLI